MRREELAVPSHRCRDSGVALRVTQHREELSMARIRSTLLVLAILVLGGATVAVAGPERGERQGGGHHSDPGDHRGKGHHGNRYRYAFATLTNAAGARVGGVWMHERRRDGDVEVFARLRDLPAGFHGFHIHTTGRCDGPAFTTAGGHFNPTGASHNAHAGDLPSLLVKDDGRAMLATITDRFSLADLRDADGSAVMVHSGPDNFANIPPRYGTPDRETLDTGDSGSRIACGVVR
jgi:Cu-Zn family superoxide dismutase